MSQTYRISVERLANGWKVTVPDYDAITKKEKEAEARAKKNGTSYSPDCYYIGDCTLEYVAKTLKEVKALTNSAINRLPSDSDEDEYDAAMSEQTKS